MRSILFICFIMTFTVSADNVDDLYQLTSKWQTFAAEFEQTTFSEYGEVIETAQGNMVIKRPYFVRWHIKAPYEQILITNENTLYAYDLDLEQIDLQPLDHAKANTPARLITASLAELKQNFKVDKMQNGELTVFALLPKEDAAMYERIALTFNADQLSQIELLDAMGQRTQVTLKQTKLDDARLASAFEMLQPEGVDVIDARNP